MGDRLLGDWALAVCTVLGAAIYLHADSRLPQLQIGDPMGPQVFPALIGIGLLASGLLLAAETRRKRRRAGDVTPADPAGRQHQLILIGVVMWTALYYLAFEPVGYLISTLVYMFVLLACFNRGRWGMNAACAVGFTLAAYAVFVELLQVALPPGVFGV
jgi:putative tricarboxylic transport membrane protein